MKICKKCKKHVPNKAKICKYCGTDVSKCKIIKNTPSPKKNPSSKNINKVPNPKNISKPKPLEIETNLAKNPPETRSAGKIIDCRRKFIYLPNGFYLPAEKVFISCQWSRRFMPVGFHFHGSARNNGCFSLWMRVEIRFLWLLLRPYSNNGSYITSS